MSIFQTVEHALASGASDLVKGARILTSKVIPALQKANADAATIEAVTSLVSPVAANVERAAFVALGIFIKAIDDAEAAGNAGGISVPLDAAVMADIKSIIPAVKASSPGAAVTPPSK